MADIVDYVPTKPIIKPVTNPDQPKPPTVPTLIPPSAILIPIKQKIPITVNTAKPVTNTLVVNTLADTLKNKYVWLGIAATYLVFKSTRKK